MNFAHYEPGKVRKLYALEPNPGMVRLAEVRRRRTTLAVEFLDLPGERIPLADACIDTVVSFEISRSRESRVRRWQRWWEPVHRSMFEGLYRTRDIPSLLEQGGLQIDRVESGYVARFPKSWSHCSWGEATPGPW